MTSRFRRRAQLGALSLALAAAPSVLIALPADGATRGVRVQGAKATATGATVTVSGSVVLPRKSAALRRQTRVRITLSAAGQSSESRTARLTRKRTFRASWTTKLTGRLRVTVRARVAGRSRGRAVTRTVIVSPPAVEGGTPLVGTFRIDPGAAAQGQAPTGSYFEMLTPGGGTLSNLSSPAANKDYTPFTPGADGGLRTDAYQEPPSPAFAGGSSGNALAEKIIRPVPFYFINFSVVTAATDAQTGTPDPVPAITVKDGRLGGQLTAWVAQWNGASFNQGTPKPDGTVPGRTTRLSGTYDEATKRFKLDWSSLIVGGPFNGFTGVWHLEGTFVPAGTGGGGLLPLLPPLPTP